jgi:hypothetical protein
LSAKYGDFISEVGPLFRTLGIMHCAVSSREPEQFFRDQAQPKGAGRTDPRGIPRRREDPRQLAQLDPYFSIFTWLKTHLKIVLGGASILLSAFRVQWGGRSPKSTGCRTQTGPHRSDLMPAAQETEFQKILPSFTDEEAAKALAIMEEVVSVNGRNGAPKVFCRFVRDAESIVGSILFEFDIGARC